MMTYLWFISIMPFEHFSDVTLLMFMYTYSIIMLSDQPGLDEIYLIINLMYRSCQTYQVDDFKY